MTNAQELRQHDDAELNRLLIEQRKAIFEFRMTRASNQEAKTHQLREYRRTIARVKTIQQERRKGQQDD